MRVMALTYICISLLLASSSLLFAGARTEQAKTPPYPVQGGINSMHHETSANFISCIVKRSMIVSCDRSLAGIVPADVPEYGATGTPDEIWKTVSAVTPPGLADKITELRIYPRMSDHAAAYVESANDKSWRLGISLERHRYPEGGLNGPRLEVTALHEIGHILALSDQGILDRFEAVRNASNETADMRAQVVGTTAALDINEDFAESWVVAHIKMNPTDEYRWRVDFFDKEFPGAVENWQKNWSDTELHAMENDWIVSREMVR